MTVFFNRKYNVVPLKINSFITAYELLNSRNGCTEGCVAGVTEFYNETAYFSAIHDDQEGVYVISGCGVATINDESFSLRKGFVYIVPKGAKHSIVKSRKCKKLEVFWFHAKA